MALSLIALLVAGLGVRIDRSSQVSILAGETRPLVAPRHLEAFPFGRWLEIATGRAAIDASCLPAKISSQRTGVVLVRDFTEGAETPFTLSSFWSEGPSGLIASCGGTGTARFFDTRRIQIPFEADQMFWDQNYLEQSLQTEDQFATGVSLSLPLGRFAVISSGQFQSVASQPISFRLQTSAGLYQPVGSTRLTLPQLQTIDFVTEVTGPTTIELQIKGGTADDSVEVRELRIFAIPSTAFEVVQVKETVEAGGVSAPVRVESAAVPRPGRYVSFQLLRIEGTGYQATLSNPTSRFSIGRAPQQSAIASDIAAVEVIDVLPSSNPVLEFTTEVSAANLTFIKSEVSRLLLGPFELPPELADGGRDFIVDDAGLPERDAGLPLPDRSMLFSADSGLGELAPPLEASASKNIRAASQFRVGCGCTTDGSLFLGSFGL